MIKTIYISGKIAGLSLKETSEKFYNARHDLYDRYPGGLIQVVNPMEMYNLPKMEWEDYLLRDFIYLTKCDAIYMLSDWQDSPGARVEHEIAKGLGLEIIYQNKADSGTIIDDKQKRKNTVGFEETRQKILKQKRFVLDSQVYTIRDIYPGSNGIIICGYYVDNGLIHPQTLCIEDDMIEGFLKGEKVPYCVFVKLEYWKNVFLEMPQEYKSEKE